MPVMPTPWVMAGIPPSLGTTGPTRERAWARALMRAVRLATARTRPPEDVRSPAAASGMINAEELDRVKGDKAEGGQPRGGDLEGRLGRGDEEKFVRGKGEVKASLEHGKHLLDDRDGVTARALG